ncbi:MAG: PQQ-binding-like beta-propeller repeat protein, partial [Phycisphaerae bacterium]|nr:PQQ-binding-like beta-propeller repeat protein [Phycisphaerae bacterium]
GFEEIAAILRKPISVKPKKHPLIWTVLILAIASAVVGIVLKNRPKDPTPAGPSATQPATTRPTSTRPAETQPTTAPTTRQADTAATKPGGPVTTVTPKPETQPTGPAIPEATFPLKWSDYTLAGSDHESNWRADISKLLRPVSGAREPKFSRDRKYVELSGSYKLGAVPAPGRLIRMDFKSAKTCNLEFWNANSKVRITIEPSKRITMVSVARKDAQSPLTVIDSCDDHYRWQSYRCYGVDIRHQDGRMMICRGEVPLLSVAMEKPPTEGKLDCSSLVMNLIETRIVGSLAIPSREIDPASIRKTNAAAFKWTLDPIDKKTEEVELIVDKTKGQVSVENRNDHIHAKASFAVQVAPSVGVEVTVHVTEFHPTTTIMLQSEAGGDYLKFDPHEDGYVEHTSDRKKKAEAIAHGRIVGREFWVRVRVGGDFWGIWISPDSKRWWRRLSGQSTNKMERITFGFDLPTAKIKDKGPRRTTIGEVTVRRFEAFAKLADPKLIAKAAEALSEELLKAYSKPEILTSLSKSADKNSPPREWTMACNTVLAARSVHWRVRCEAMRDLLADAIAGSQAADLPKILAAIDELSDIGWQTSNLGAIQYQALEALGRNCLETGRRHEMEKILNVSYMSPIGRHRALVLTPELLRIRLQDLMTTGQWETVRREAMRAVYHAGSTNSYGDRHILPFTLWALSEAQTHLADESDPKTVGPSTAWRRSLVVNDDREMLNMLGEFMFLIKGKHYKDACKIITARTMPDDLVALGDEDELLQSSHFRVRETIRATPELRTVLKQDYVEIGNIRLERASRQNDLAALKSLAVQFYGTSPGFGAMHVLADRDLSNGNFWGAASRYELLAGEEGYDRRADAAAKHRLASAMLGRLVGKPADKPVALPGGTFSAKEFEAMVTRLAADRKKTPAAKTSDILTGPEPRGKKAKVIQLAQIPGDKLSSRTTAPARASFAMDSQRLLISFADKLLAVDRNSGKVSWFHEPDAKQRSRRKRNRHGKSLIALAVQPIVIGDRMFVRHGVKGRPLTCFDTKTGKSLWSKQYDEYVLSDPVMLGSWVSVITASQDTTAGLQLHRVSPSTGESSLSSRLVRLRDLWPAIGRPAVIGDSFLFHAEGCLVNCNIRGSVRWARRLPFIPSKVMPAMHTDTPRGDMITRDGNVIFSMPGSPYLMSISALTGKTVWSFMIRPSTQLLGMHAGNLIVVESDRICALDPDTGKLRWSRTHVESLASVCPGAKDTLVSVYMAKPSKSKTEKDKSLPFGGRFVRWISAKNGDTVKEIPIEGAESAYHPVQITGDGKRIFGLSNYERSQLPRMFMLNIEN